MIDIHCHVLPGIDDGAEHFDEAVEMCRLAAADGCEVLFATPHQRHPYWPNLDADHLAALRAELTARAGVDLRIESGGEIRIDDGLLGAVDELPSSGILPLGDSRYLLLECHRGGMGPAPESVIHELAVAGWRPILAHPEHYPWLMDDLGRVRELVASGALLQITGQSLVGGFGRRARQACHALLDSGLAHFVASDAHGTGPRPPGLRAAYEQVTVRWGRETAQQLMVENPRAILANEPIPSRVDA